MKAMILAAGRGSRLQPITDILPKPLVQVGDKTLIEYHIEALRKIGVQDIIINVSHLAEKIQNFLGDGSRYQVNLHYSVEEEALETGGGVFKALNLLGSDPFILISGDIFTDYDLTLLPKELKGLAHLVLTDNPDFHPEGDFCLKGKSLLNDGPNKLTYASISLIHPDLFKDCQLGKYPIGPLLRTAVNLQQASGEYFNGLWFNVSTLAELNKVRALVAGVTTDLC